MATRSILAALALVVVPATNAGAADWSLKALFSETALYEDNRSLAPISPGPDYGLTSALTLDLLARTPTCEFHLRQDFSYPYYFGPGAADLTNEFQWSGAMTFSKKVSETTQFNLMASLTPESTKTSEVTDSGETTLNATRWTTTYGGTVEHQLTSLDKVTLSATSTAVQFTGASGNLIPYKSDALSGAWEHRVSRLTTLTTTLGYSDYSSSNAGTPSSHTYSATLGAITSFTRRLSAQISGGVRATTVQGSGTVLTPLADANLTYKEKRGEISVFASQSAAPSSTGGVQNTLSFGVRSSKALNRNAHADFSIFYNTYTGAAGGTRSTFTIAPSYSYELNRNSEFRVGYTFARDSSSGGSTLTNTVALNYSRRLTKLSRAELSYTFEHQTGSSGTANANTLMFRYSKDMDILPP